MGNRTHESPEGSTWAFESRAWLERLRDRIALFVLIGAFGIGLVVAEGSDTFPLPYQNVALALALVGVALSGGLLYTWRRGLGAWWLAVAGLALPLLVSTWGGLPEAV